MPAVSIIIPVFNVEKYLRRCLDSCINQTLSNIEIIVINDCSSDNCDVIMREYEKKYPDLIKCLYLPKNIRQGGARNRGLKISQGEYVLFLDGDDWISLDCCEELYKSAKSNNADIVEFDHQIVYNDKIGERVYKHKGQDVFNKTINIIPSNVCFKLFKRELILKSEIDFPENCYYEDIAISGVWYLMANIINYAANPMYYYYFRSDSTVHEAKNIQNRIQYTTAILNLIKNLQKSGYTYSNAAWQLIFDRILMFVMEFTEYYVQYGKENLENFKKELKTLVPDIEVVLEKADINIINKKIIKQFLNVDRYIDNLYDYLKNDYFANQKICIWGYGVYGKKMIEFLEKFNKNPDYIIDNDKNLQNTYTEKNTPIICINDIPDDKYVIIVAINKYNVFEDIKNSVCINNEKLKVKHYKELFILE